MKNKLIIGVIFMLINLMKVIFVVSILTSCGTTNEKETIKEVEKAKTQPSETVETPVAETETVTVGPLTKDLQPVVERIEVIENKPATAYDNVWRDPVTDDLWLLGEFGDWDDGASRCSGDWVNPDKQVLLIAVYRGLLQALQQYHSSQSIETIWSATESESNALYGYHVELNASDIPQILTDPKTDTKFTVCYKENEE